MVGVESQVENRVFQEEVGQLDFVKEESRLAKEDIRSGDGFRRESGLSDWIERRGGCLALVDKGVLAGGCLVGGGYRDCLRLVTLRDEVIIQ